MGEYKVCWGIGDGIGEASDDLSFQVALHLKDGWILQGSVSIAMQDGGSCTLAQAMVKPAPPPDISEIYKKYR